MVRRSGSAGESDRVDDGLELKESTNRIGRLSRGAVPYRGHQTLIFHVECRQWDGNGKTRDTILFFARCSCDSSSMSAEETQRVANREAARHRASAAPSGPARRSYGRGGHFSAIAAISVRGLPAGDNFDQRSIKAAPAGTEQSFWICGMDGTSGGCPNGSGRVGWSSDLGALQGAAGTFRPSPMSS